MYQWLKTPGIWVLWHGQDREGYSVRHQSSCQNKRGQIWELHGWENHTNTHVIDTPWGVCSYIGAWDATAWMKIDTKCCYHFLTLFIATWMQPWKFSRSLLPSISFVCLCLLKLNRFPKRKKKKKKHCRKLSYQQRALHGLEDGRYLVFWRGSSFNLFLNGRHFETPLIQSHIGT